MRMTAVYCQCYNFTQHSLALHSEVKRHLNSLFYAVKNTLSHSSWYCTRGGQGTDGHKGHKSPSYLYSQPEAFSS